ncbi:MAG: 4'-phosphopantetheinyl transferase superfamily protein [Candidatus Adiutrix sp.]|nr:4'-phosphopantetheinyl transferase superfamily protein [Candidatus Adiutrix sp.]
MAALLDDPAWADQDMAALFSPGELSARRGGAGARGWLLGRLAAKAAAGRRWRLSPAEVEIKSGPAGRPWSFRASAPAGFISLSHTRGAAAAVAADRPVGVDLEPWSRPLSDRAWTWSFAPGERRLAESGGSFPARLALWCAKEAAAKSWGRALLDNLPRVRVAEADWPAGRLTVAWRGRGRKMSEVRLSRWDAYLVALAQSRPE